MLAIHNTDKYDFTKPGHYNINVRNDIFTLKQISNIEFTCLFWSITEK